MYCKTKNVVLTFSKIKPAIIVNDVCSQQKGGYQRGLGVGEGEMGKEGQIYGNGWKLDFWW